MTMNEATSAAPEGQACKNTDRELWREREGDYYAASIFVTKDGGIGINVGGTVFTMPLARWHVLAAAAEPAIDFHSDDFRKARPGDRWPRFEQPLAPAPAVAPEALATPSFANSPDSMWLPTQGGSGTSPNWFGLVKVEDIRKAMTMIEARELSASAALSPLQSALAMSQSYAIQGASVVLNFRDDAARSAFTAALVEFHQARLTAKPPAAAPDVGIEALSDAIIKARDQAPLLRNFAETQRLTDNASMMIAYAGVLLTTLADYAEKQSTALSSMAQRVQSAERERDDARQERDTLEQSRGDWVPGEKCKECGGYGEDNEARRCNSCAGTGEVWMTWKVRTETAQAELDRVKGELAKVEKDRDSWKRELKMYSSAWRRELGGSLFNKRHYIDALVITTRCLREQKDRPAQAALIAALRAYLVGAEFDHSAIQTLRDRLADVDDIDAARAKPQTDKSKDESNSEEAAR